MSGGESKGRAPEAAEDLTHDPTTLALVRTRFAADRTLMAWMRTSVSLIGFGFSIFKFFQYVEESGLMGRHWNPREPRVVGLVLIALGLSFLLFGLYDFRRFIKRVGGRAADSWAPMLAAALLWIVGAGTLVWVAVSTAPK